MACKSGKCGCKTPTGHGSGGFMAVLKERHGEYSTQVLRLIGVSHEPQIGSDYLEGWLEFPLVINASQNNASIFERFCNNAIKGEKSSPLGDLFVNYIQSNIGYQIVKLKEVVIKVRTEDVVKCSIKYDAQKVADKHDYLPNPFLDPGRIVTWQNAIGELKDISDVSIVNESSIRSINLSLRPPIFEDVIFSRVKGEIIQLGEEKNFLNPKALYNFRFGYNIPSINHKKVISVSDLRIKDSPIYDDEILCTKFSFDDNCLVTIE
jgi:hypothetical protein